MTISILPRVWFLLLLAGATAHAASLAEKKIIYYGWSSRDTAYVRAHWQKIETLPFDGLGITVAINRTKRTTGNGSTANLLGWHLFGPLAFDLANFSAAIADLQTPAWQRFTDNFLPAAVASADQDHNLTWFDDARWATIENNWRVLLSIARGGNCRGILLDPEHYDYRCELFSYANHRTQRVNRPFNEYTAAAYNRGRRLGTAAREIYPGITIAMLYGYTLPAADVARGVPLESSRYALLPSFLDGILEASAPEARFVDLWEFGHRYKTKQQFLAGYEAIKHGASSVTTNSARVQVGFSLKLDRNYFSPARFQTALQAALEVSDQYVWIYSERGVRALSPIRFPKPYLKAITAARQPPP